MLATLQRLGVMPSFSRPAVSNDNRYPESLFKNMKYRPNDSLVPFVDLVAARQWVMGLVEWYHYEHRHSAICFVTPAQRYAGLDGAILEHRKAVDEAAHLANPPHRRGAACNWRHIKVLHLSPDPIGPHNPATVVKKRPKDRMTLNRRGDN
jgi:putative transposase